MGKHRVMIPCDEATRLLSEAQDRSLGAGERTVLRMHTWLCSGCRQFGAQVGFIRQAAIGDARNGALLLREAALHHAFVGGPGRVERHQGVHAQHEVHAFIERD